MLAMMMIVGAPSHHAASYFEQTSGKVLRAFVQLKTAHTEEVEENGLEQARARDALLLGGRAPSLQAGALGSMVMGAAVVFAAHAPARLRPLVDGPVHFGPALFDGGGMGAAIAGRF